MTILFKSKGGRVKKIEPRPFDDEAALQKYLFETPEVIQIHELRENTELTILARELPVDTGSVDAIAMDSEGNAYVIEAKLYKNQDKRQVLAQVLDYGAAIWSKSVGATGIFETIEKLVEKQHGTSLSNHMKQKFGLSTPEDCSELIATFRDNLEEGRVTFIILMDQVHAKLKTLIEFLNANSNFQVLAAEINFYKSGEDEIIIPQLLGAEKSNSHRRAKSSARFVWDELSLFAQAKEKLTPHDFSLVKGFYESANQLQATITFGTGARGSFNVGVETFHKRSIFMVNTDGRLNINFHWLEQRSEWVKNEVSAIGLPVPANYQSLRPSYPIETWRDKVHELLNVLKKAGRK